MWYEAIPSFIAMGAAMSLIEISPFVTHYLSWGCPMMRNSHNELSVQMHRRDGRIAEEEHNITHFAQHQYTYGLGAVKDKVKQKGNFEHYARAEKAFLASQ